MPAGVESLLLTTVAYLEGMLAIQQSGVSRAVQRKAAASGPTSQRAAAAPSSAKSKDGELRVGLSRRCRQRLRRRGIHQPGVRRLGSRLRVAPHEAVGAICQVCVSLRAGAGANTPISNIQPGDPLPPSAH
jgi:hypothetical protein